MNLRTDTPINRRLKCRVARRKRENLRACMREREREREREGEREREEEGSKGARVRLHSVQQ